MNLSGSFSAQGKQLGMRGRFFNDNCNMLNMKLLFLVSSLPIKKTGGTEIITLRICEELAKERRHEPFIYTIPQDESERSEETLSKMFESYGITNFPCSNLRFSRRVNSDKPFSYTHAKLSFARGLKKLVLKIEPDVVVSMKVQPPELFCNALPSALKKTGIPYLLMVRGFTDLMDAGKAEGYDSELSPSERLKNRLIYARLLPRYIRSAAGVVVQTHSQHSFLRQNHGRDSRILFNPIDVQAVQGVLEEASDGAMVGKLSRNIPSKDDERFKLVYVGSMIPRKNLETLLRAVHFIVKERGRDEKRYGKLAGNMVLYLVGGGKGSEKVRKMVAELSLGNHVVFTEKMSPRNLWPFLAHCDVFVFPSLSEGFPNAVLEAMACSLPIISSDFAGAHDLIVSGKNGLIFKKKDSRELAEKIMFIYENDGYRNEVARNNQQFVRTFTWKNFLKGFEQIIQELT